jgi:uncharacterized membrane protein YqaE (UPF0057 family)
MANTQSNVFKARLAKMKRRQEAKRKSALSGGGPIAKIIIFFLEKIIVNILIIGVYNFFIDVISSSFNFVNQMFFSDFKGFLAGKLKSKNGTCIEYTYFRYFLTLMVPPLGIFLARGLSAWFNIFICGFLCFLQYFPGLIYAIIVIQSAPYANRYHKMKQNKLYKGKTPPSPTDFSSSIKPLIFFLGTILITMGVVIMNSKLYEGTPITNMGSLIQVITPFAPGAAQSLTSMQSTMGGVGSAFGMS